MPPRAMATATISFGLVSIPVKLYTSSESAEKIAFRLLHDTCKTPLKRPYWCPACKEMVTRPDITKGFEYAKDNFALFSDEEIKAVEEEVTRAVDIAEFLPLNQIDPVYYDSGYYMAPDKGGDRSYRLLSIALEKSGLAGLAKYAARGKQYLVLVRPLDGGLVLQQLKYPNEVRSFRDVPIDETVKVKDAEIKLALQLIEQTATDKFQPEKYEDEVKLRLQEIIQQKIEGQEVTIAPGETPKAQVVDLMEALRQSLAASGKTPAAVTPAKAKGRKPAKKSPRKKAAKKTKAKTTVKKRAAG